MSTSRDDFGIAIRSALLQRGAKQKFSLFVLILVSSVIFALDNIDLKAVKVIRNIINDGIYRVSAISSSPSTSASSSLLIYNIFYRVLFLSSESLSLRY